jgi:hypothetical protein
MNILIPFLALASAGVFAAHTIDALRGHSRTDEEAV